MSDKPRYYKPVKTVTVAKAMVEKRLQVLQLFSKI